MPSLREKRKIAHVMLEPKLVLEKIKKSLVQNGTRNGVSREDATQWSFNLL